MEEAVASSNKQFFQSLKSLLVYVKEMSVIVEFNRSIVPLFNIVKIMIAICGINRFINFHSDMNECFTAVVAQLSEISKMNVNNTFHVSVDSISGNCNNIDFMKPKDDGTFELKVFITHNKDKEQMK